MALTRISSTSTGTLTELAVDDLSVVALPRDRLGGRTGRTLAASTHCRWHRGCLTDWTKRHHRAHGRCERAGRPGRPLARYRRLGRAEVVGHAGHLVLARAGTQHRTEPGRDRSAARPGCRARTVAGRSELRVLRQPVPRSHPGRGAGPRHRARHPAEHARTASTVGPDRLSRPRGGVEHRRPAADRPWPARERTVAGADRGPAVGPGFRASTPLPRSRPRRSSLRRARARTPASSAWWSPTIRSAPRTPTRTTRMRR